MSKIKSTHKQKKPRFDIDSLILNEDQQEDAVDSPPESLNKSLIYTSSNDDQEFSRTDNLLDFSRKSSMPMEMKSKFSPEYGYTIHNSSKNLTLSANLNTEYNVLQVVQPVSSSQISLSSRTLGMEYPDGQYQQPISTLGSCQSSSLNTEPFACLSSLPTASKDINDISKDETNTKLMTNTDFSAVMSSLTALATYPMFNWCAKCNASFRMTSDLVHHMRTHHKRRKSTNS